MEDKRFYVEFCVGMNYLIQSRWFDNEKEAREFFKESFDLIDSSFDVYLMSAVWDEEEGCYGDITQEEKLI